MMDEGDGKYDLIFDVKNSVKEMEGEQLSCWGRIGYEKPKLSDIWVPAYLVEKPIWPKRIPHSLDVVTHEPSFSVIPKRYEGCVPKSVQALMRKHSLQMPAPEEYKNFKAISTDTSSSNNVSSESLAREGTSSSNSTSCGSEVNMPGNSMKELPVYEGKPVVYQKSKIENEQLPVNRKVEKNKKKLKKNKQKQENSASNVVFIESPLYAKNALPFECKDSHHFSINLVNLCNNNNNYGNVEDAQIGYMKEHFKQNAYNKPKLDADSFPELPNKKSFLKGQLKYEEVKEVFSPNYGTDCNGNDENGAEETEASSIIVLDNIPKDVDEIELCNFLDAYSDATVVSTTVYDSCISVELKIRQDDASWIAECVHNTKPFMTCKEPVICYVK